MAGSRKAILNCESRAGPFGAASAIGAKCTVIAFDNQLKRAAAVFRAGRKIPLGAFSRAMPYIADSPVSLFPPFP